MVRHLPNFLTLCNLLCGCFGVVATLQGQAIPAAYFIWIACAFDFFDGFVARALKVQSSIGKELDSLADMVSFGVLPSVVLFSMIGNSTNSEVLPYIGFMVAAFSALRLAIFNIDETQRDSFKGLPTPANAIFISALPLLTGPISTWISQTWILISITITLSFLLVSRVNLFALKFKDYSWKNNQVRFTFLLLSVLLLAILKLSALPLIIILYIGISLGVQAFSK